MATMALSDTTIRSVKPGDPRRQLTDGNGLYLLLYVNGGKHGWRFDYKVQGKRKTISLGTYPATSLSLARAKANAARELVAAGIDPSTDRKSKKAAEKKVHEDAKLVAAGKPLNGTFEAVAREWFEVRSPEWAAKYAEKVLRRLEADVFPHIGIRPVGDVTAPELLAVLRRIEDRGVIETAHTHSLNHTSYSVGSSLHATVQMPLGSWRYAPVAAEALSFFGAFDWYRSGHGTATSVAPLGTHARPPDGAGS